LKNPPCSPAVRGAHDQAPRHSALRLSGRAVRIVVHRAAANPLTTGQPISFAGIGRDMVLLLEAADRIDAATAGHGLQLREDNPVLHTSQIGGRSSAVLSRDLWREVRASLCAGWPSWRGASSRLRVVDRPHVDLAQARRDSGPCRLRIGRRSEDLARSGARSLAGGRSKCLACQRDRGTCEKTVARQRPREFEAPGTGERGSIG